MHRVSYVGVLLFFWKGWVWGVCIGFFILFYFNFGKDDFSLVVPAGDGMGMMMVMVNFGGIVLLWKGKGVIVPL